MAINHFKLIWFINLFNPLKSFHCLSKQYYQLYYYLPIQIIDFPYYHFIHINFYSE